MKVINRKERKRKKRKRKKSYDTSTKKLRSNRMLNPTIRAIHTTEFLLNTYLSNNSDSESGDGNIPELIER